MTIPRRSWTPTTPVMLEEACAVLELGTTPEEWAAARERMLPDHLATADEQLAVLAARRSG